MSELLKSHHLMTRYHDNYEFSTLLKDIIDSDENSEMRQYLIGN